MPHRVLDILPTWGGAVGEVMRWMMVGVIIVNTSLTLASFLNTRKIGQNQQNNAVEQRIFSNLKDAESGQRAFLYSEDEQFLPQYYVGVANAKSDMLVLLTYLHDDPLAQPVLNDLKLAMRAKIGEMEQTIALVKVAHDANSARTVFNTNKGVEAMENIRTDIGTLAAQGRDSTRRSRILF